MKMRVKESIIKGNVKIPGSKSHTIRALILAGLAEGKSIIKDALFSQDTKSCERVLRAMGSEVTIDGTTIVVNGAGKERKSPEDVIDVGNSGTTLNIALGVASTINGCSVFTGDYQIRKRPLGPLIKSLNDLGANVISTRSNGLPPIVVNGLIKGGDTSIEAVTSQFLTSLLISAPLAEKNSRIKVPLLNEAPYVEMTMWWLDKMGIKYFHEDMKYFEVEGGQSYKPFEISIPGDFSSATFFAVLGALSENEIILENLDMSDTQGDKEVLNILRDMGAKVEFEDNKIKIKGGDLKGIEIDMNSIPDALPAMAVVGCFAKGETKLLNVPQARLKETDRISVMCSELEKMGADIEELPDGLIIRESKLKGSEVSGHDDHRIVMALAVAGMKTDGETIIDTAEAMNVTFPEFLKLANSIGGKLKFLEG